MTEQTPVKIFKQTYFDAIRSQSSQNSASILGLVLEGIVCAGVSTNRTDLTESMTDVNEKMAAQARAMGATQIFGVRYEVAGLGKGPSETSRTLVIAYGDAYKKK